MRAKIKIFRYNPEQKGSARYDEYSLDIEKGKTILDCLIEIKTRFDSSLTFERSCESGICGGCAVRINGKSRLACHTQSLDCVQDGAIVIEPLPNFPVVKDLVVDKNAFWDNINQVMPYLVHKDVSEEEGGDLITEKQVEAFKNSENCIMCGICYSECTSVKFEPNFIGPAAATKAYRFIVDPRDARNKDRLEILDKNMIWACSHQFHCTELCPKNIDPGERICNLKSELMQSKFKKSKGAKNSNAFYDSLKKYGKLDFRNWGVKVGGSFISEFFLNTKLDNKSRNSPLFMKKIANHSEIKKLLKRLGEK